MDYRKLNNEELIDLLFTEEDRLPQEAAEEIVRRGDELLPELSGIVLDRVLWTAELPDWWAPVHAAYMLGALATEEAIVPLLSALRWSDAYDCEWVVEELPSMFGTIGLPARKPLEDILADRSAGWSARAMAMDSLAAIGLRNPEAEGEIMKMVSGILSDEREELGARRAAAVILIDFRRVEYKEELISFATEEQERFKGDAKFDGVVLPNEVEKDLLMGGRDTDHYARNWLRFYDPAEIEARQQRWAEEDAKYRVHPQLDREDSTHSRPKVKQVRLEDPCPCGSGKKYRRCCWEKLH